MLNVPFVRISVSITSSNRIGIKMSIDLKLTACVYRSALGKVWWLMLGLENLAFLETSILMEKDAWKGETTG